MLRLDSLPTVAIAVLCFAGCAKTKARKAPPASARTADALFRDDQVTTIRLGIERANMAALAREPRDYVRASLTHDGHRYKTRLRFKGHRAMESWAGKPAFKLKFSKKNRFLGLRTLILNNMVEDPTMLREALGYHLYRSVGVPAPRTGYARVYVNNRLFGLYLVLEATDPTFLKRHFSSGKGMLYEGEYGCDLYPEDAHALELERGEDPGRAAISALAAAAVGPVDALYLASDAPLDAEEVLKYLAVSAFTGDFDGYRHAHNYRVYRDPATRRWSMLPWGLDRVFKDNLDIYDSGGVLAKRCFADAACRLKYIEAMQHVLTTFEGAKMQPRMDALQELIAPTVAEDRRRPYTEHKTHNDRAKLRQFLKTRVKEVRVATDCIANGKEIDRDGDGHGCFDCDDKRADIHPGAPEVCDNTDNDCSGFVDDGPDCSCPIVESEGATFLLCDFPMSWQDARAYCQRVGAELARIDSDEQSIHLAREADRIEVDDWWIGLDDRAQEGAFRWIDGEPIDFERWGSGEPDNYRCGQNCGAIREGRGGKWRDMHCATRVPFICRKPNPSAAD